MKRLTIVGTLPETSFVGGVSVHVQRLLKGLDAKGINYFFIDYKRIGVPKTCLKMLSHRSCVHIHVTNPILLLLFVFVSKLTLSKTIFTLHANHGRFKGFKSLCLSVSMRLADTPILINPKSYQVYRRVNKHAQYIPAFIPPTDEPPLPESIKQQIKVCMELGQPIVSTNASKFALDKEGNDLYGIDFLVNYFIRHEEYTLLVSDPKCEYRARYGSCKGNIVFVTHAHSYFELLKNVDVFVRNTSTDGDALSVKEALYLGLPALCSDVVDRPDGVILFSYSDDSSFSQALSDALTTGRRDSHCCGERNGTVDALLSLYTE